MEQLYQSQSKYFNSLTEGNYDRDYIAHRLRVGMIHEQVGLEPAWYLSAYRQYLKTLVSHLHASRRDEPERFLADLDAFTKVIFLDMGLAMEAYYHATHARQRRQAQYLMEVLEHLPTGVLLVDMQGTVTATNLAAREILGLQETAKGSPIIEVLPLAPLEEMIRTAREGNVYQTETSLQPGGNEGQRFLSVSARVIKTRGEDQENTEILISLEDLTDPKRIEEEVLRLATSDILTGLPNRMQLMERLNQGIVRAKRSGSSLGCFSSIWTTSRMSTIPWDMRPETSCCSRSPRDWDPGCAKAIRSPVLVATNSFWWWTIFTAGTTAGR